LLLLGTLLVRLLVPFGPYPYRCTFNEAFRGRNDVLQGWLLDEGVVGRRHPVGRWRVAAAPVSEDGACCGSTMARARGAVATTPVNDCF
jgi:hypothetical protein